MKNHKFYLIIISFAIFLLFFTGVLSAQTTPPSGEEELFNASNDPDALLLFDLSGSMDWNPRDGSARYGNSSCSGTTFYSDTSHTGYTTDCRKITIAKTVLFNVLNDNSDTVINSSDRSSLGVRFGYMRFRGCAAGSEESTVAYGSTATCTADLVNCSGSTCGRSDGFCNNAISGSTRYASTTACTADTANCAGTGCANGFCDITHPKAIGAITYYANSSCTIADTVNCAGTGCVGGFCSSATSVPSFHASSSCTTPDTVNCAGTGCSGGFCNASTDIPSTTRYYHDDHCTANTNRCKTSAGCSGGSCPSPQDGCAYACISPGCAVDCSGSSCSTPCETTTGCLQSCTTIGCEQNCAGAHTESWTSGCNTLVAPIDTLYSCIYCRNLTSCSATTTSTACTNTNSIITETASGGTHLAAALNEAKMYLTAHKAADPSRACRKKFVILLSDGEDTFACRGNGSEGSPKARRESVAYAKQLADAGFNVFVIGFGQNMASVNKNTLNWMARYGGTDNPNTVNVTGTGSSYEIPAGSLYPTGITSCQDVSTPDPGSNSLSGYAFFAEDIDSLTTALKTAISIIRESTYSFTQASVQSSRTSDENYIYEASFEPVAGEPFWHGHLKKFPINTDGSVGAMVTGGDAAVNLQGKAAGDRVMKTYVAGSWINFATSTSIDHKYFGYDTGNHTTDTASSNAVIGYIRGDTSANPDIGTAGVYKLGDVFRSTPITVATPSLYYSDNRDKYAPSGCTTLKTQSAFADHRSSHCRASSCSDSADRQKRLVAVGANDGQLHAFKTSDVSEAWSFVPPNLLNKLKMITHPTNPTTLSHQYYVDGQVTVADVWLGTGSGTCKAAADWRTLLVFGEGRGTNPNTWSASPYCDFDFSTDSKYSTTYPYYCGYYALNLNDSLNPAFMWTLKGSGTNNAIQISDGGPYLGDAWSKMMTGRVIYGGVEKWVGFIGGGYNGSSCTGTTCGTACDCRGKGFFVIDLSNGQILWSFTLGSTGENSYMKYSIPSDAAIVDTDNDGFIDTAYIGDLGGNMWRFKFCKAADAASCPVWSGARLFNGTNLSTIRPIYVAPSVTKDDLGNLWVYWGTGDKNDPINIPASSGTGSYREKIFGLKDDYSSTFTISNFQDITSSTFDNTINNSTHKGYYINLPVGEKMLAEPLVFGGVLYFTTYTPPTATSTDCTQNGNALLYAINYTTGAGALTNGDRSVSIGQGIPSAPVISMKPGGSSSADLYVTVSSGIAGGTEGQNTGRVNFEPPGLSNRTNILFWKDRRLE